MKNDLENDNLNSPWLIKANSEILGPFSLHEVFQKILKREIVLLDECCSPNGRWHFLRDDAEVKVKLQQWVEQEELENSSGTQAVTGTLSVAEHTRETTGGIHKNNKRLSGEQQYSGKPSNSILYSFLGLAIIAILGLGAYIFRSNTKAPVNPKIAFHGLVQKAVKLKNVGEFKKALVYFRKARKLDPKDSEIKLLMAPLVLKEEKQTVLVKRLLQGLALELHQDSYLKDIYLNLGLAALHDLSFKEAKNYFDKSIEKDPQYFRAYFNMGVVYFKNNDLKRAIESFQKSQSAQHPLTALTLAQTNVWAAEKAQSQVEKTNYLKAALSALETVDPDVYDYRQEISFLMAYILFQQGDLETAQFYVQKTLKTDPLLTSDHVHDLLLSESLVSWNLWANWCDKLGRSTGPEGKVLNAYCLFRANKQVTAYRNFEEVSRGSQNSLVFAYFSYFLEYFGKPERALASLKTSLDFGDNPVNILFMARRCLIVADLSCAKSMFNKLSDIPFFGLHSDSGMAQLAYSKSNLSKAKKLVHSALNKSPNYAPMLKLELELRGF